jgi:hypothetical protein
VEGDAKALAVVRGPGERDLPSLVVTRNNAAAMHLLFSPPWRDGAFVWPFLSVGLRGPAGNPTGVGARIELLQNGKVLARGEVQAGGSYLAQSSPVVMFAKVPADAVVRVHWPDGSSSETKVENPSGSMTVTR